MADDLDESLPAGQATLAIEQQAWRRRARPLLGTLVEVAVLGAEDEAASARATDAAFACIARYHAAMSFHEAGSDVRAIANATAGATLQVAPQTWAVIAAALAFEAESAGVFNVAVAPALVARGCLPAPAHAAGQVPPASSALASLRLEEGNRVTIVEPVWIDLGGIAKGAAVDAALAAIRERGAAAAIVNAGGDLATYGNAAQPIVIRGPGGILAQAGALADGAIATSGPFGNGDEPMSLVMRDGQLGLWADRSVSVVAPTCLVADALTKVLAAQGPASAPLLLRHAARGFSIDAAGRLERVG